MKTINFNKNILATVIALFVGATTLPTQHLHGVGNKQHDSGEEEGWRCQFCQETFDTTEGVEGHKEMCQSKQRLAETDECEEEQHFCRTLCNQPFLEIADLLEHEQQQHHLLFLPGSTLEIYPSDLEELQEFLAELSAQTDPDPAVGPETI